LGLLGQSKEPENQVTKDDLGIDPEFDLWFLEELDESLKTDGTLLKIFLEDPNFVVQPSDWESPISKRFQGSFPIEFRVLDACVTNSNQVWFSKHFYF
jgi:hypothetical protein